MPYSDEAKSIACSGFVRGVIVLLLGSLCGRALTLSVLHAQGKTPSPNPVRGAKELVQQASALIEKDKTQEAIPLLRKAVSIAPSDVQAHYFLGYALWKQSEQEVAEAEFKKALELDPNHVLSMYFLARIAQTKEQWTRSARFYERVVASGQIVYDSYLQLSQVYLRQGQK